MSLVSGLKYTTETGQKFAVFRGVECGYYYVNEKDQKRYITKQKLSEIKAEARAGAGYEPLKPCYRRKKGKTPQMKIIITPPKETETDTETGPFANGYKAYQMGAYEPSYSKWKALGKPSKIAWTEAYLMKNPPGILGGAAQLIGLASDPWKDLQEKEGISPLRDRVLNGFDWWVSKDRELNFADFSKDIKWQDLPLNTLAENIKVWNEMPKQSRIGWILQGNWDDTVKNMRAEPGFVNYVNSQAKRFDSPTFDQYLENIDKELHNTSKNSRSNSKPNLTHKWDVFMNQSDDAYRQKYIDMKSEEKSEESSIPEAPAMTLMATPEGKLLGGVKNTGNIVRMNTKDKVNLATAIVVKPENPLIQVIKEAPKADKTDLGELKEAMAAAELRATYRKTCKDLGKVWDPKTGLCVDVVEAKNKDDLKKGFYTPICEEGKIYKKGRGCIGIAESGIKINIPDGKLKDEIENFNKQRLKHVEPFPKSVKDAVMKSIMEKRDVYRIFY